MKLKWSSFWAGVGVLSAIIFAIAAAAPMPIMRGIFTTNVPGASYIGSFTHSNALLTAGTNFVSVTDQGWQWFGPGRSMLKIYGWFGTDKALDWAGGFGQLKTNGSGLFGTVDATAVPLTVTAASGQTADAFQITDSSSKPRFQVNSNWVAGSTNWTGAFAPITYTIFRQTNDATILGTTSETSLLGTGVGTSNIIAGTLTAGSVIEIETAGIFTPGGATDIGFKLMSGSTILLRGNPAPSSVTFFGTLKCKGIITLRSTNTAVAELSIETTRGISGNETVYALTTNQVQTVNFAIDNGIDIRVTPQASGFWCTNQIGVIRVTP